MNQSKDMFWSRVEIDYNNSKPKFITQLRGKGSLQCRMQTILITVGKLRGCVRQIESLNPSGASEQDIITLVQHQPFKSKVVTSQSDSPTPESPTSASPRLYSFSLNITDDEVGGENLGASDTPNTKLESDVGASDAFTRRHMLQI
ncbi:hypothetical protein Dsin_016009 [Dipteronia sinensis]|uniref:Uncharacterized protein n=1 Tax=Dipteronia sinensis TaxID=43782 RepID=A0AAE0AD79_9ROSI|nr:hypothetical protein Dsin_016009 [Dipteronia sinensis]